jgi:arylsulfatase A-like enzyme
MRPLSFFALLLFPALSLAADPPKPNIVWICADDLAAYPLGCYGDKLARTPNIDAFAKTGVRFDRAYCNSPVCTASRQSFLTGRYPRSLGVTQLKTALPDGTPTLATMLKAAGYDTASVGKMHFNSALKHGFDVRHDQPDARKEVQARKPKPLPDGVQVQPPWKPFNDHARIWLNSANRPFGAVAEDMPGTLLATQAIKYLEAKRERPFFLMVSFYEPHSPFHYPADFDVTLDPKAFTVPKVGKEDDWHIPAIFRDLTDAEKRGITAAYYTSAAFADRNIGRVLDALKKAKLDENTIVLLTGDHGYMLGHHGRFEKHCCYEPAIRAPLIVRMPGVTKAGSSNTALTELIDIAPTLLERAGVKVPAEVQGKSLTKVLSGEAKKHREFVVVEYSENEEACIRTDEWKLIYTTGSRKREDGYATGQPLPGRVVRLFDLTADPEESTNLAAKPDQVERVTELMAALAEHLARTAREPKAVPAVIDVHELFANLLQPRDVPPAKK